MHAYGRTQLEIGVFFYFPWLSKPLPPVCRRAGHGVRSRQLGEMVMDVAEWMHGCVPGLVEYGGSRRGLCYLLALRLVVS